jgi:hypothetical protein
MREILIEQARRKDSRKRGGGARRVELSEGLALIAPPAWLSTRTRTIRG